jgi:parvulin-like peptidyl-prolyl isomerase
VISLKSGAKKIIKLLCLNIGIAAVDTILFSPGLLGIGIIGASAFETALSATTIFMSIVIFGYGNYNLLKKEKIIQIGEIKTADDCIYALNQNYGKRIFEKDITTILEQIEMFQKKRGTIKQVLLQKFDITEISYSKFDGVISDIENVFYINIKSIINKLNAFDEEDYNRIRKDAEKKFSKEFINTKMRIYSEYMSFVKKAIENNEQIILKLDKLLLELSKFNSLEDGKIENMSAMKEVDELINKIRLYD